MPSSQTWFVTGASQGLGAVLVEHLAGRRPSGRGHHAIAGRPRPPRLRPAAAAAGGHGRRGQRVRRAVQAAIDRFGRIDVLVNNAGYGLLGGVEEIGDAEARRIFDVNVFGLLNVTRVVLPFMREAGGGHVLNLSSVFGLVAGAGWGLYCSTKFAVEGLSEALAQEVEPFGVKVTLIEPGYFRTNFLTGGSLVSAGAPVAAYDQIRRVHEAHERIDGTQIGDPVQAARAMIAVVDQVDPPLRLLLGSDALTYARAKLGALAADFDRNEPLTRSTDYATPVLEPA
jgi:NAD(P)-dependent dehydrogenase (short-subunit alcohol dehydrogenase family)